MTKPALVHSGTVVHLGTLLSLFRVSCPLATEDVFFAGR